MKRVYFRHEWFHLGGLNTTYEIYFSIFQILVHSIPRTIFEDSKVGIISFVKTAWSIQLFHHLCKKVYSFSTDKVSNIICSVRLIKDGMFLIINVNYLVRCPFFIKNAFICWIFNLSVTYLLSSQWNVFHKN